MERVRGDDAPAKLNAVKLVLCLPGERHSAESLGSLLRLARHLGERGIEWRERTWYSANVFFCRNSLLGVDPGQEVYSDKPLPFGGSEYDYMLWADSDAVFEPEDFDRLLARGKEVVAGITFSSLGGGQLSCGRLNADGSTSPLFEWMLPTVPLTEEGLIEVDYTGFHLVLMKKGAMEAVGYPWFMPYNRQVENRLYFPSEDIGWSLRARAAGLRIFADPRVMVGHEKTAVLKPASPGKPAKEK